jgi:hypothetical protein
MTAESLYRYRLGSGAGLFGPSGSLESGRRRMLGRCGSGAGAGGAGASGGAA